MAKNQMLVLPSDLPPMMAETQLYFANPKLAVLADIPFTPVHMRPGPTSSAVPQYPQGLPPAPIVLEEEDDGQDDDFIMR
jgi:hypothetical protein